jgi:excisionase family DNA binding protein
MNPAALFSRFWKFLRKGCPKSQAAITDSKLRKKQTAASEYLGLKISSLRTRIWAGEIPIVRFQGGRKIFVDREDLEDFIQRNKETYT